ncbi:MAG TPA: diaminopimelate epimerase [Oligoflexia bacterium]|nr:diaminopimelate epimerase [Oligoflexia bacterium]HMP27143.1 diaminopimelate epimerase [Oligoflexia bacterium]
MNKAIQFYKLHGCGNSFIFVNEAALVGRQYSSFAKFVSGAGFGIGADGLFVYQGFIDGCYQVMMFNPDGSDGQMCANGLRCLARYLFLSDILKERAGEFLVKIGSRQIAVSYKESGKLVKLNMGSAIFLARSIPIALNVEQFIDSPIEALGRTFKASVVSVGNPHLVVFGERMAKEQIAEYGSALEHHPLFPDRINVEFVQIIDSGIFRVQVWERGAGMTLACGSGACAVAAVAKQLGLSKHDTVIIEMDGGSLMVSWDGDLSSPIYLEGPAEEICRGELFAS